MHADVGFLGVAIAGLLKPSARMRSEGYCSRSVSVCVCVDAYSRTTGYEVAHYQRLQNYASLKNERANFLKRLRSRDMP